jgi:PPOX class probable F420-dependent enzyme
VTDAMRERLASARAARLATVRPDGSPHIVPVVFALSGETALMPVDHKPKRTTDLQRLRNIAAEPRAALLVDAYDDDWTALWWVRLDGRASLVEPDSAGYDDAVAVLAVKYEQYRQNPITGPIVALAIERWTDWAYSG